MEGDLFAIRIARKNKIKHGAKILLAKQTSTGNNCCFLSAFSACFVGVEVGQFVKALSYWWKGQRFDPQLGQVAPAGALTKVLNPVCTRVPT